MILFRLLILNVPFPLVVNLIYHLNFLLIFMYELNA